MRHTGSASTLPMELPVGPLHGPPAPPGNPQQMPPKPRATPKRNLIRGAFWTVGTRWAIKGIGFLNTVIMARLLMPADYGMVAMAMLVVGLIQAMMDFDASTALLRKGEVSKDEIDSAWTLKMLESLAVGLILLCISPLAAGYFEEPRVQTILWTLAVCVALTGMSNVGMTLAQRDFRFHIEFRLQVVSKTLSVLATIVSGYLLRDYRALVIGISTGYISNLVMSYVLHPYRPHWNTSKIGEIWAVTKWLMLAGIGSYLLRKSDELIAARLGTAGDFGLYNVGSDLGRLPIGELGPAMLRAFLPVLSSIQDDVQRTNAAVLKTLAAVNSITLPMGFGVAAIAVPLTELILGPQWTESARFVALFALVACTQCAMSPLNTLLILRGHTRSQSVVLWVEFVAFMGAAALLVPHLSFKGLVWARLFAALVNALVTAWSARKHCGVPLLAT
ncbi:lipopolysaccharide biosynthesis protein, partial [Hydrogenophaga sp.]|uniref:lipopolysaccharide biosynthesis protein n=1 Tax=Hydrogenophaga sp. TaxID=1904254 RepID=UPI0035653E7A